MFGNLEQLIVRVWIKADVVFSITPRLPLHIVTNDDLSTALAGIVIVFDIVSGVSVAALANRSKRATASGFNSRAAVCHEYNMDPEPIISL